MRRRRRAVLTVLILLLAAGGLVAGLGVLLKREPAGYRAALPGRAEDADVAFRLVTKYGDARTDIRLKPRWAATFTADEVNALLRDQFDDGLELFGAPLTDPRVTVAGDRLTVAGRLGEGRLSTVVSLEVRAWLVGPEPNTVAVELCGLRAGGLPVGGHWLMDRLTEAVRDQNIEVTWYRHDGHPVGLFRLFADQGRPATQFRSLTVADGGLTVTGQSATAEAVTPR